MIFQRLLKGLVPFTAASVSLFAGCVAGDDATTPAYHQDKTPFVVEGSADSVGMLRLLNAPTTTRTTLHVDASVDRRAAASLIHHRDGADGIFPSPDDNMFDSVAEVGGIKHVQGSTLGQLVRFARDNRFVPGPLDKLGTYDDVAFTVVDAERVLDVVNRLTQSELDYQVGLDRRAAKSITAARPVQSLKALSELFYVGGDALESLKIYAEPAMCSADSDCRTAERCVGRVADNDDTFGLCHDVTVRDGEGGTCDNQYGCGPGLICAGLTLDVQGSCNPVWMAGRFETSDPRAIEAAGISSDVVVRGLAEVPVDILVSLDIEHANIDDLVVTLVDPAGSEAIVWSGGHTADRLVDKLVVTGAISREADVNGRWTLTVRDRAGRDARGQLRGWALELTSRW